MSLFYRLSAKWLVIISTSTLFFACASPPESTDYSEAIARPQAPPIPAPHAPFKPAPQAQHSKREAALDIARAMLGTPYRYGGSAPGGFDCSGLVQYSFKKAGVTLPRTSRDIFRHSRLVNPAEKQPGDLVFFAISAGKVSHVGIYSGSNRFIHSPSSGKGVSYASLGNPYWQKRLVGVGRI